MNTLCKIRPFTLDSAALRLRDTGDNRLRLKNPAQCICAAGAPSRPTCSSASFTSRASSRANHLVDSADPRTRHSNADPEHPAPVRRRGLDRRHPRVGGGAGSRARLRCRRNSDSKGAARP